ncbi:DUF6221 family protein [Cellulosimicrobium cellulans]|uniref:DUF6221 family protein n=1 Tax=Cellulosimicrobium cellulans TaxID=1710 RepID=UPI0035DAEA0D
MTATVVEFLTARLDEDEAIARAADVKQGDPSWTPHGPVALSDPRAFRVRSQHDARPIALVQDVSGDADDPDRETAILDGAAAAEHIARHDPARVLADVAGKRRIIEAHPLVPARDVWGEETGGLSCETCDAKPDLMLGGIEQPRTDGCVTLRALAAPYAGHPDYDERWTL